MASTASNILEYVVWLVWNLLTLTPAKLQNPIFPMVLTQDVLEQLLSDSVLVFAPCLLDVFQAATPPSVAYLKSLPTDIIKRWAVYLLVRLLASTELSRAPRFKTWASTNVTVRKHYCRICDYAFTTRTKLEIHEATQKHIDKAAAAESS